MQKFTKDEVLQAINNSLGIMSTIAKKLHCDWRTAQKNVDKWEETRNAYENEKSFVLDLAENGLYDALVRKEQWAVKFILTTKGQERGYVQSVTTKIENSNPLNVKFDGMTKDEILQSANVEIGGDNAKSD